MFAHQAHFREIDYPGRRKIAGLFKAANPDFMLFGSMQGVGFFKQAIKNNPTAIKVYICNVATQPGETDHFDALAHVRALQEHCKAKLAPYKYPRWIEFRADLPKTATGKIQRFRLRAESGVK